MSQFIIERPERYLEEKRKLEELAITSGWLTNFLWGFCDGELCLAFHMQISDKVFEGNLIYPSLFPDVPAFIAPQKKDTRWSEHQYGRGTLCLEWGPDNWLPTVTGADLLNSAYKLLMSEAAPAEQKPDVPSRHQLTDGQRLRSSDERFILTPAINEMLAATTAPTVLPISIATIKCEGCWVSMVTSVNGDDANFRTDIPYPFFEKQSEFQDDKGWLIIADNLPTLAKNTALEILEEKLRALSCWPFGDTGLPLRECNFLFLHNLNGENQVFLCLRTEEKFYFQPYDLINVSAVQEQRLPTKFSLLKDKSVAIVGLGSVGSKIAISLARSGIRKLLLVDDDYLMPENFKRHQLNWRSVGLNKAVALKKELALMAPRMEVSIETTRVAGQENAKINMAVMERIGNSDLVIDATANSSAFLALSAICKRRSKPLVWGELFAGGIGGLMARSKSNEDATSIRNILNSHLESLPPAPYKAATGYDVDDVLIASDADAGMLSASMTQFALDLLINPEQAEFPHTAYLMGYKKKWIFREPFDTHPIAISDGTAHNPLPNLEAVKLAVQDILAELEKNPNVENSHSG